MDSKTPEIRPVALEPWVARDYKTREPDSIKPVPKDEGASFRKVDKERDAREKGKQTSLNGQKVKELTEEVQRYLSDINVDLIFEIYDKTGELVVKIIDRDTKKLIRQIPPEDLLKLHDRLVELRGALFARKA
jgi:flagellar protein FlaG